MCCACLIYKWVYYNRRHRLSPVEQELPVCIQETDILSSFNISLSGKLSFLIKVIAMVRLGDLEKQVMLFRIHDELINFPHTFIFYFCFNLFQFVFYPSLFFSFLFPLPVKDSQLLAPRLESGSAGGPFLLKGSSSCFSRFQRTVLLLGYSLLYRL